VQDTEARSWLVEDVSSQESPTGIHHGAWEMNWCLSATLILYTEVIFIRCLIDYVFESSGFWFQRK
jgi:hypothetical protein